MAEPRWHSLLMKGPLVLATMRGDKTQTRRLPGPRNSLVDGGPWPKGWTFDFATASLEHGPSPAGNEGPYLVAKRVGADTIHRIYPRYAPGDFIRIRETWRTEELPDGTDGVRFRADDAFVPIAPTAEAADLWMDAHQPDGGRTMVRPWQPSIFLPTWACRLVVKVESVRAQWLQETSAEDARAEGLTAITKDGGRTIKYGIPDRDGLPGTDDTGWPWEEWEVDPRRAFQKGWDSINAKRPGASWEANPPVWPITYSIARAETAGRAA